MTILSAHGICKAYGERELLKDAEVQVSDGERIGVVGRNGAGKSTLSKILAGKEPADAGTLALRRGARVSYLEQEPDLPPEMSAREVVALGLGAWSEAKLAYDAIGHKLELGGASGNEMALLEEQSRLAAEIERLGGWDRTHEIERVLTHLGITRMEQATGTMSGGQRRRVALARVLVTAPDLMILDEPTNHLDADSIDWLEQHLAVSFKGALLMVTHDRWLLDRVADRTLEVSRGQVYSYEGGYGAYLEAKAERTALEERTERNRQNFLRTEIEWLRRQPKARTTKQKARIDRAESAKAAPPPTQDAKVQLSADVAEVGRSILDVRKLSLQVEGRVLIKDFDLALTAGERLGILGPNGSGKTSLLRCILGELPLLSGELVQGRRVRIGYLDQTRAGLDPDESVLESVARAVPTEGTERIDPRTYLERFAFDGKSHNRKVSALSGGERARLCLARLLASAANLLLLDEPTNDLDVETLGSLENALEKFPGCAVVISHDRWFLDRTCTHILAWEGDATNEAKWFWFEGNFGSYEENKLERLGAEAARPHRVTHRRLTRD
jgi:ATP-binding cassette subfamily F protein uup